MPDLLSSDLLQSLSFLVDIFLKYLAILDWPFSFMTKALKTLLKALYIWAGLHCRES